MLKNNEMVKGSDNKELQREEVNVYASCSNDTRNHCLKDCFWTNDCFISCAE